MLSEELQKLTASEPLSLEEEYQMQKSWIEDEDSIYFVTIHITYLFFQLLFSPTQNAHSLFSTRKHTY